MGGTLKDYIKIKSLTRSENLQIAQKIACAMAYLEEERVIHRDLAARNVFVGRNRNTIKLGGFEMARCIDDGAFEPDQNMCPYQWTAPEAFVVDGRYGKVTSAADVWSFGVVLWEMYSNGKVSYSSV
ncbi:hypothetical protein PENTCL1PPCAC_21353, partial [Pristionchus entomophagus]